MTHRRSSLPDSLEVAGETPLLMGVVNVTPDSFSDGGHFAQAEAAVAHGQALIAEGADLLDIGGESSRPGAAPVSPTDEMQRVLPVIEALAEELDTTPIAVDTRKAEVARAAVAAGASLINDISAGLGSVAAELGVTWVVMHMQGDPQTMQASPRYDDVVDDVLAFLDHHATQALAWGVPHVWIDPGVGFGKTHAHNLALLHGLDRFVATGHPVLLGTSRKSFLGRIVADSLGLDTPVPAHDRLEGSLASAVWGMTAGVHAVRVHDVAATRAAVDVLIPGPDRVPRRTE